MLHFYWSPYDECIPCIDCIVIGVILCCERRADVVCIAWVQLHDHISYLLESDHAFGFELWTSTSYVPLSFDLYPLRARMSRLLPARLSLLSWPLLTWENMRRIWNCNETLSHPGHALFVVPDHAIKTNLWKCDYSKNYSSSMPTSSHIKQFKSQRNANHQNKKQIVDRSKHLMKTGHEHMTNTQHFICIAHRLIIIGSLYLRSLCVLTCIIRSPIVLTLLNCPRLQCLQLCIPTHVVTCDN